MANRQGLLAVARFGFPFELLAKAGFGDDGKCQAIDVRLNGGWAFAAPRGNKEICLRSSFIPNQTVGASAVGKRRSDDANVELEGLPFSSSNIGAIYFKKLYMQEINHPTVSLPHTNVL